MEIFVESPWPAVFFGVVGEAILAVALVRSGRGVLLWAMAGVLALSLAGVAVARLVVTEKKLAAAVIYDFAAAAEKNDVQGVLRHISPEDEELSTAIVAVMQRFEISDVEILRPRHRHQPPDQSADRDGDVQFHRDRQGPPRGVRPNDSAGQGDCANATPARRLGDRWPQGP